MFDLIKQKLGLQTKESRSWQAILSLGITGPQWTAGNYQSYVREGYTWNPIVYACVNKSVTALRSVDFGVYRKKGTGKVQIAKGPLAELIARPNPRQSFGQLVAEWTGSMEVSGNGYLEGVSTQGRAIEILSQPPKELYCLRPDRMFVVPGDPQVPVAGYEYRAGSSVVPYPVQLWRNPRTGGLTPRGQVMHSKYWNPTIEDGDWYGLSPIKAAARSIDSFNSAVAWNVALTQNAARTSGVFSTEGNMTPVQAEEYTDIIRRKFSGAMNAGRPMVLGMGMKWQQMGLSPVDMDWLSGLQWNTRQICAVYGIPPQIISDEESKTYANYQEANKAVWLQKWIPLTDMLVDDLNTWLAPLFWDIYGEEVFISYDREAIEAIQEDRQLKWKNAKDGTGFLRINEQRALLGYDPLTPEEGGECILVPVGMVPLHVSSQQEDMPNMAVASFNAENAPDPADPNASAKPGGSANKPAGKPKPKPKKKPKDKKKPGRKGFAPEVLDAEYDEAPDPADMLLKRIGEARESLKLLSGE